MKRITHHSELPLGKIFYHVYGFRRQETEVDASRIGKMVVLSKPYAEKLSHAQTVYFIEVECTTTSGQKYKSTQSLGDMGVMDSEDTRRVHNLNRVFSSVEDALAFQAELQQGIFTYDEDQAYFNNHKYNPW